MWQGHWLENKDSVKTEDKPVGSLAAVLTVVLIVLSLIQLKVILAALLKETISLNKIKNKNIISQHGLGHIKQRKMNGVIYLILTLNLL